MAICKTKVHHRDTEITEKSEALLCGLRALWGDYLQEVRLAGGEDELISARW